MTSVRILKRSGAPAISDSVCDDSGLTFRHLNDRVSPMITLFFLSIVALRGLCVCVGPLSHTDSFYINFVQLTAVIEASQTDSKKKES